MIITDKFVFIHLPKTGGTFVRKVLTRIHEARGDVIVTIKAHEDGTRERDTRRTWKLPHLLRGGLNPSEFILYRTPAADGGFNQHGSSALIPPEHRNKQIVVSVRNPYDRYVSSYEFGWWKMYPEQFWRDVEAVYARLPHYPELTFEQFVHLNCDQGLMINPHVRSLPVRFGRYSSHFLRLMARVDHNAILQHMDRDYVSARRYQADLHDAHYLYTDQLNQTLYDFLRQMDYAPQEIEFVLTEGRILPEHGGRREDQKWENYYTPELRQMVRETEWLLFELFPRFDS